MRIRPAVLLAVGAATALALTACTGNQPPPNYATTGPDGGSQNPAPATPLPTVPRAPDESPATTDPEASDAASTEQYEQCPATLVDTWLHLGTGDDVSVQDFEPRAIDVGTQPVGDAEVACAVGLDYPDGTYAYVLAVLTGAGVPEAVAAGAAEDELDAVVSGQTGAVAAYTAFNDTISYTLFGPPDPVASMSGIDGADTAFLLEGTLSAEDR